MAKSGYQVGQDIMAWFTLIVGIGFVLMLVAALYINLM